MTQLNIRQRAFQVSMKNKHQKGFESRLLEWQVSDMLRIKASLTPILALFRSLLYYFIAPRYWVAREAGVRGGFSLRHLPMRLRRGHTLVIIHWASLALAETRLVSGTRYLFWFPGLLCRGVTGQARVVLKFWVGNFFLNTNKFIPGNSWQII